MHEEKSVDIELYSVSKMRAAFEAADAADEQPAADAIAALKDRIMAYLAAGKSISWVISVLQRGGLDKGARQIRTYLQRAGIGDKAAKRRAGRSVRKSAGQQKAEPAASAEPAPHAHAKAEAGRRPAGQATDSDADGVKPSMPPSRTDAGSGSAEAVQEAGRRPAGQPAASAQTPSAQPPAQSAAASAAPQMTPKTEAPAERKAPPSQEQKGQTAKEKVAPQKEGQPVKATSAAPQTAFGMSAFGQSDDADDGDPDSLL